MLLHKEACAQRNLYLLTPLNTDTFKHRNCYTQKPLHWTTFTYKRFCTRKLLRTEAFTRGNFYTQKLENTDTFIQRGFCTEQLSHTEAFAHGRLYTQHLLHRGTFTHRNFHSQTPLHTDFFYTAISRNFCRERPLRRAVFTNAFTDTLTHRSLYTQKFLKQTPLHRETLTDFTGSDTRHDPGGLRAHSTMHVGTSDTHDLRTGLSRNKFKSHLTDVWISDAHDLCTRLCECSKMCISTHVWTYDTHDLRRALRKHSKISHVTTRLDLRHARSLQRVAWAQVQIKIILHHTRRISAEGPVSMDVAEQPPNV